MKRCSKCRNWRMDDPERAIQNATSLSTLVLRGWCSQGPCVGQRRRHNEEACEAFDLAAPRFTDYHEGDV